MLHTIIIIIINNNNESVWVEGKGTGRVREGETSVFNVFFFCMYLLLYITALSTPHALTLLTSSSASSSLNDTRIFV